MSIVYLIGIPAILFTAQLLLSSMVKGLYFRLVPLLLWAVSLALAVVSHVLWGGEMPGLYLNILLPRLLAIGAGWFIGHLIKKKRLKNY